MRPLLLTIAALALLASCAPAPLYTARPPAGAVTSGEVPRDSRGEPVWGAIKPAPAWAQRESATEG